jgi:hypothetical protein
MRILLQTTLPTGTTDDWTIGSFSLLQAYLSSLVDLDGKPLYDVIGRDREPDRIGNDPILSNLSRSQFDQIWLFALDTGDGLSKADAEGINRFHSQGGGVMATRDHQDMGICMTALPQIGRFHYFNSQQLDPESDRCLNDDCHTTTISYPNYHSGANGDYQTISPTEPIHQLLKYSQPSNPNLTKDMPTNEEDPKLIKYFPSHPHEGGIGVTENDLTARVIATGISKVTGRSFNLAIAAERIGTYGRIVAQSTFHHFVDFNWEPNKGCPSFVIERSGNGMAMEPQALADIHRYVANIALWLCPDSNF